MTGKQLLLTIVGVLLAAFGLLFTLGGIVSVADGSESLTSGRYIFGTAILGMLPLVGGLWLCVRSVKQSKQRKRDMLEGRVLKLATQRKGRVTVAEVANDANIPLDRAKALMEDICMRGYCEMKIAESGTLVYEFKDILTEKEKQAAEDLM